MRKITALLTLLTVVGMAHSQNYQTSVHGFDLEKLDRHKGWRNYGGFVNADGQYVLQLARPYCDANVNTSYDWANATRSTVASFRGVGYTFEELVFDQNFNYLKTNKIEKSNSLEAVQYYPALFGQRFDVPGGEALGSTSLTNVLGAVGKGMSKGTPSFSGKFSSDFIGQVVVTPGVSVKGSTILTVGIVTKTIGDLNRAGQASCRELPAYYVLTSERAREEKGQYWADWGNAEFPGGGVIAYFTSGVLPKDGKQNMIIKKFDAEGKETNKLHLPLDFKAKMRMFKVKRSDGKYDFVAIALPTDDKQPYVNEDIPGRAAHEAEIIYLNGDDLSIGYRLQANLKFGNWFPTELYQDNAGNVYLMGKCSDNPKAYTRGPGNLISYVDDKNMPNYQIVKFGQGKLHWVLGIDAKGDAKKIISVPGSPKGLSTGRVNLDAPREAADLSFTKRYMVISGQQITGAEYKQQYLAIINNQTGELEHYLIKPDKAPGWNRAVYSADSSTLYWATIDYTKYNKYDNKTGIISSSKIKNVIAGELYLCHFPLSNPTSAGFSLLGAKEWVIEYRDPMVVGTAAAPELVFQGRNLAKKAKDQQLVLVKVKK
jgi:hypothetical protein